VNEAGLSDELAQVDLDLAEIEEQLAIGELDTQTAQRLRAIYLAEGDRLRADSDSPPAEPPAPGRSGRRIAAGALVLGLGAAVIVVAAVASLGDRTPGGNLTGGVASDVLSGDGVDLESVSNEQMEDVIAANPDIVPMRLALARRYFMAGEFSNALDHYLYILQDMGREEPEALANVGWMTHLSGQPDLAVDLVERSIQIQPDNPQGYWFLANIEAALGDQCAAADALAVLFGYDDLPEDITAQAMALADSAEASCER
jgi:tetratricopeptide (TPR) repeat protein